MFDVLLGLAVATLIAISISSVVTLVQERKRKREQAENTSSEGGVSSDC